ncbi:MAG: hypothetical protein AAF985_13615 [Bacteroidota bacterium]
MTKSAYLILGSTIIIGLSLFSMSQFNTIDRQGKAIVKKESQIAALSDELSGEIQVNDDLRMETSTLREQISILRDSIAELESKVKSLRKKLKKQDRYVRSANKKLKNIEMQYGQLKEEISRLVRADQIDKKTIAQLEEEKKAMRQEIEKLNIKKDKVEADKVKTEQQLMAQRIEEARFKRLSNILNNTQVQFERVSTHKKRFGKKQKKVKGKNWYYTLMEFQLINENVKLLLDERFIVKIVNSDTQEILSYIESNPNFPKSDKDSKGVTFKYDGNLIEVAYYNNQKKEGKNYEAQIFYIDDNGKEYLLRHGIKQIIQNRRPLALN